MATYDSVTRWASKTDRKSVQLWLPRDVVAALDEQAADQNKPDPVTGGQRKVSRADVITLLVREGRGRWSELVYGMEELMGDWKGLYEKEIRDREEAESEAEETREAQSKAERLADQLEGEVDALKVEVAKLEKELRRKDQVIGDQNRRILKLMAGGG